MGGLITSDEAKEFLRVDADDDSQDGVIATLIAAASRHIEDVTGFVCPARVEEFRFDRFSRELRLPLRPIDPDSVVVDYIDPQGAAQSFTDFRIADRNGLSRVLPVSGARWPATECISGAVTVTASAGYPDEGVGAPEHIRLAALQLVAAWFTTREAEPAAIPANVELLLSADRPRRL